MTDEYTRSLHLLEGQVDLNAKVWFDSSSPSSVDQLNQIKRVMIQLRDRQSCEDDNGILDYIKCHFLRTIWISENPSQLPPSKTEEVSMLLFETNEKPEYCCPGEWTQLQNLKCAMDYLDLQELRPMVNLTLDLIQTTNRKVTQDLVVDNGGQLRTTYAAPSGYSFMYARPKQIPSLLNKLIAFVNVRLQSIRDLEDVFKLGTVFFSEFLKIHPFRDGNGRTARLLLNWLFKSYAVVPFSVYWTLTSCSESQRDLYCKVLIESQQRNNPSPLAKCILGGAYHCTNTANYLLMD